MGLTLAELDALTTNDAFLARVRQAVRERAAYVRGLPGASDAEKAWEARVLQGQRAAQIAANMAGELVCDGAFAGLANADASDLTDSSLKTAVETYCEKYS